MKYTFIMWLCLISACGYQDTDSDRPALSANTIAVDTVNRVVMEPGRSASGKKVILYTNGTWSYAPMEETRRDKKARLKKEKQKRAEEVNVNTFYVAPEKAPVRKTEYTPAESSISGICGAPTRKGGACRRRVRGGGHCWQHGG